MPTWLIVVIAVVILLVFLVRRGSRAFQIDSDVVRLTHLQYYTNLIEEYRAQVGHYPMHGRSDKTLYVFICNPDQRGQMQRMTAGGDPRMATDTLPFAELLHELSSTLGRDIDECYDPQLGATSRPNFYIYMVQEDDYFLAVHLAHSWPFAERVGPGYFKVEVGSQASGRCPTPQALFESPDFQMALKRPLGKPGFYAQRAAQYRHATRDSARAARSA